MTRPDKIRLDAPDTASPGRGDYAGTGIWSYSVTSHETRELMQPQRFRTMLDTLAEAFHETLPPLYHAYALDDPRGQWEVFPDARIFKVTTADGRVWYARYGLVSSWNHDTHSWLWSWAFPQDWNIAPDLVAPGWALHREAVLKGWSAGVEPSLLVNEREAMRLTYLAAHTAGMPLIYRARVNDVNTHFFVLDRPTWAS